MQEFIRKLGRFLVYHGAALFTLIAAVFTFAFGERLKTERTEKAIEKWMKKHHPEL